jgi:hypothetical protein
MKIRVRFHFARKAGHIVALRAIYNGGIDRISESWMQILIYRISDSQGSFDTPDHSVNRGITGVLSPNWQRVGLFHILQEGISIGQFLL